MSQVEKHSELHAVQVHQKGLSVNGGHTVYEKDRLYTIGREVTVDSRARDATRFPNANQFTVTLPDTHRGCIRIEVQNLVLPVPVAVGTEAMAFLRLSTPHAKFERGATTNDNFWYTLAIPLSETDSLGRATLKVTDNGNRPMVHFIPSANLGRELTATLWIFDPTLTPARHVPYPFNANATIPAHNYHVTLEFICFE